ncbi:hypothetical protein H4R26_001610 [Coemansia thaxteri]|uniref:Uncharacterized protein n=1 Tax=Coemansia thaxteri TaxID=2663907 RepID=A0A9W8EGF9_9FUNG|nr:hypothetical protein H4R26_001610 [Coemansia thaxteri]
MSFREDGRVMCTNGHEQAGIVEEDAQAIVAGTTRRRQKSVFKRQNVVKLAQQRRLYGNRARFLVVEVYQHILKSMATALVRDYGAPDALDGAVRNLWLSYVSKLDNISPPDDDDGCDGGNMAPDFSANPHDSHSSTLLAEALFTQHTQSQRFDPAEDSLDSLLRRVDDDIAKDEEEMMAWDRDFLERDAEERHSPVAVQDSNPDSRADTGTHSQYNAKLYARTLEKIETYPRMEYLPALLCLAYRWLRLPMVCADMFRLLADGRLPYLSAHANLPADIQSQLGSGYSILFQCSMAPSTRRLVFMTDAFACFFAKHYSIEAPLMDTPQLLLSLISRLGLDIQLYSMVMRLLELVSMYPNHCFRMGRRPEVVLVSSIIVVLKMHYGLDEIERHAPPAAAYQAPNLPPLQAFLDKWRDDWEAELCVGVLPYLTDFGDEWEAAFAASCRRLMSKNAIPRSRSAYKEIAVKYRRMLESLASESQMSAEHAARILPPEYAKRFGSTGHAVVQTPGSEQTPIANAMSQSVRPVRTPCTETSRSSGHPERSQKRPPYTMVEPLGNHPEIQLEPGELYVAMANTHSSESCPGYMVPTMGLVYARCAMVVGCSQTMLSNFITALEDRIDQVISHSNKDPGS